MKKALGLVVMLFALASIGFGQSKIDDMDASEAARYLAKADWVAVSKNVETLDIFSMDKTHKTIIREDDIVSFFIKSEKRGQTIYQRYVANCATDTMIYVALYSVLPSGKLKYYQNTEMTQTYVPAGTVAEMLVNFACTPPKPIPIS